LDLESDGWKEIARWDRFLPGGKLILTPNRRLFKIAFIEVVNAVCQKE
jgi:hypothetical protein|tara:strand:+ start:25 stop:168 length:144 start_codon:yes stop_codon:yes gene_type:complete